MRFADAELMGLPDIGDRAIDGDGLRIIGTDYQQLMNFYIGKAVILT